MPEEIPGLSDPLAELVALETRACSKDKLEVGGCETSGDRGASFTSCSLTSHSPEL
jgi:hypothetical protein